MAPLVVLAPLLKEALAAHAVKPRLGPARTDGLFGMFRGRLPDPTSPAGKQFFYREQAVVNEHGQRPDDEAAL